MLLTRISIILQQFCAQPHKKWYGCKKKKKTLLMVFYENSYSFTVSKCNQLPRDLLIRSFQLSIIENNRKMSLHDVSKTLFCYNFASVIHALVSLATIYFSHFNYEYICKRLDKYVDRILFSNHIKIQMNVCPSKKCHSMTQLCSRP